MLNYAAPKGIFQWMNLYRLYRKAFPLSERKPFAIILKMYRKGKTDIWYFTRDGKFAGLIFTVNGSSHILLDYLAVEEKQRGAGIGSEILQRMHGHYAGKGVFLEIESIHEESDNKAERLRRRQFYLSNGMKSMEVFVWLFGVKMELLGFDCKLSYDEYLAFYRDNYSPWAAEHIQEAEIPVAK